MKRTVIAAAVLLVFAGLAAAGTRADLSGDAVVDFATTMDMPLMTVGNPVNPGEQSRLAHGDTTYYGRVNYVYNICKFEVTTGQYTEFLNAVAATDTYGLYNEYMWDDDDPWEEYACKIQRSGSADSYTYSVAPDWEERPVNYVSWGDAARFANWLTNGMPTGGQDLTTTEDGSYVLNGATSNAELMAVTRKTFAQGGRYCIPTEDEWYKAAYHKNDGVTGNYFDFPTSSDAGPSSYLIDPDPGNTANFYRGYTIGSPYWRTEVGEFENSQSPYGTFDQGGNVWEWNEAVIVSRRGLRGGSFGITDINDCDTYLRASYRVNNMTTMESGNFGFRISEIPEPASAALMLAVGGLLVRRKRKRMA